MTTDYDARHMRLIEERDAALTRAERAEAHLVAATDAIEYALSRVGTDAEFAYHMLHTETLDRLTRAYARIKGRAPKDVCDEIMARVRVLPQSRCQANKEWIEEGGAHGDV